MFLLASIPVHELGHLIFGLFTGYEFCSYRLFSFVWYKEDGRIKFKKATGVLMGQCLMVPSRDELRFKFVLYNLGGGILNLVAGFAMLILALAAGFSHKEFFLAGILSNVLMGLLNLIPLNLGTPNDGLNVAMALKSKEAKHCLFLILFVNGELSNGKRYQDFDDGIFALSQFADLSNFLVANIVMQESARLYDKGEFNKSFEQNERIDLDKLPTYYRNFVLMDYLYHYLVHRFDVEKAREIYIDKKLKPLLNLKLPQITRVTSAYEYFINNDREKARLLLERAKNEAENYPNKGISIMEQDYCLALEKLIGES